MPGECLGKLGENHSRENVWRFSCRMVQVMHCGEGGLFGGKFKTFQREDLSQEMSRVAVGLTHRHTHAYRNRETAFDRLYY